MVTKIRIALVLLGFALAVDGCGSESATQQAYDECLAFNYGYGHPAQANGQGGDGGGDSSDACTPACTPETVDKDCAALSPHPRCGSVACIENKCVPQVKVGLIPSQKYGDCKQLVCDKGGNLIEMGDDTDFYNDANQCTIDFCKAGATHFTLPDGVPCPETGDGYCFQGACVECVSDMIQAKCSGPGTMCDAYWCVSLVDCIGKCGGNCAPCAFGYPCLTGADCLSGVCANNKCQSPSCTDGVKNDGETGVDCGSASCEKCPVGEGCETPLNCASKVCMLGICQEPTCTDGEQNGNESGVDCGGACEPCVNAWEKDSEQ